jgi:hypothetical protein
VAHSCFTAPKPCASMEGPRFSAFHGLTVDTRGCRAPPPLFRDTRQRAGVGCDRRPQTEIIAGSSWQQGVQAFDLAARLRGRDLPSLRPTPAGAGLVTLLNAPAFRLADDAHASLIIIYECHIATLHDPSLDTGKREADPIRRPLARYFCFGGSHQWAPYSLCFAAGR